MKGGKAVSENLKVEWILYSLFFIGYLLYEWPNLLSFRKQAKLRRRLNNIEEKDIELNYIGNQLFILMGATLGLKNKKIVSNILKTSIICVIMMFFFLSKMVSVKVALAISIVFILAPYLILKIKLHFIRVNSSKEGDIVLSEILNNYKICYYNMKDALETTARELENAPNCRKIIFDLVKGLNKVGSKDDIRELLNVFRYSLGTSWGNVLASNIYFAEVLGIKVTASLSDLLEVVSRSRDILEHTKRENNESNLIFKYMVPLCFLLTILAACKFFGFTLRRYLEYQFMTQEGIIWVLIILSLYSMGIVINIFLTKKKMDV